MSIDLQIKVSDTRDWQFTISDSSGDALDLTGATVQFRMRKREWDTTNYFVRNTGGTGSDYITISTPASDGIVTITPTMSDWVELSDASGIFVGEFHIIDSNGDVQFVKDVEIGVQDSLWG